MLSDSILSAGCPVFQPERLLESCEDDAELAREVVADFLHTAPQVMTRLSQAVSAGDAGQARLEAHSLKGSSQTLGAEALALTGAEMEEKAKRGDLSATPSLLHRMEQEFRRLHPELENYLYAQ